MATDLELIVTRLYRTATNIRKVRQGGTPDWLGDEDWQACEQAAKLIERAVDLRKETTGNRGGSTE